MNKVRILIVDDYAENIRALEELIAAPDIEVSSATNATAALELISANDFGLALLDVQMPEIDGFQLATTIRSVSKFRSLPIIFVTAHSQDKTFAFEGYKTGAVDLLFKPLNPEVVRAKVRLFVEMAHQKEMLRQQVRELERLRLEAHSASVAKSQFLANMSHEIRTPLTAVMGFAEIATSQYATNDERDMCSIAIKRNGEHLMKLIDEILDLSKIEANRLELDVGRFSLTDLMSDIAAVVALRASEKGIDLKFQPQGFEDRQFVSDFTRIKQVLINVIGNAIKFTENGGRVDVSFSIEERAHNSLLVFEVKDTGIGLSSDQQQRLFQPFVQADSSTTKKFGGTGLGLAISRQIARALGGDLKVTSTEIGIGSTFEIRFVVNKVVEEPKSQESEVAFAPAIPLHRLKVLVVDDSKDNLVLLSIFLKKAGISFALANSGREALDLVEAQNFDVIFMDIQMPEMDGHQTTRELRQRGFKNAIIALTAHALVEEHEKCLESGCDQVLTKPITQKTLIEAAGKYSKAKSGKGLRASGDAGESKKIVP